MHTYTHKHKRAVAARCAMGKRHLGHAITVDRRDAVGRVYTLFKFYARRRRRRRFGPQTHKHTHTAKREQRHLAAVCFAKRASDYDYDDDTTSSTFDDP